MVSTFLTIYGFTISACCGRSALNPWSYKGYSGRKCHLFELVSVVVGAARSAVASITLPTCFAQEDLVDFTVLKMVLSLDAYLWSVFVSMRFRRPSTVPAVRLHSLLRVIIRN